MAEAPIGKANDAMLTPSPTLADPVAVLDGGTGFLKAGYAGQVSAAA